MARYSVDIEANIKGFDKLDNIEKQIKSIQQSSKNSIDLKFDVDADGLKGINKQFDSLGKSAGKSFETAIQKQINTMAKTQRNAFSEPLKNITKVQKSYDDFWNKELSKPKNKNYGKNSQLLAFEEFNKQMLTQAKKAEEIRKRVSQGFTDVDTSAIKKSLNKYVGLDSNTLREAEASYSKLISLQKELKTGISDDSFKKTLSDKDVISRAEQYIQVLEKCKNQIKVLSNESGSISKPFNQLDAVVAGNKTLTWLNNNTKAAKEYGEVLEDLAQKQKSATNHEELANYNKQVKSIISDAQVKGLAGKSAIDEIGRAFKQIGQFATTYGVIQNVEQLIVESISDLKDMNSILTEISKTSDLTTSQLKELGKSSFESASQFGKTAKDYLLGVQEMSRSGFYGEQAEELAKLSILGQAAGDMSADVSNSYLLATNAAYDYKGNAEKLNAVLDGQNMITNRNSVAMQDMAEATTQAGSQAAQYGVEIDQLSALVGTAVARTKKSGNEVGTALKALFINLQNTQNAKITGTFDKLGISMTKMVGDSELLKTPIELLKELSKVYTSLPEGSVEKADILTNIGGKHHANVLSSILSGYSDYEKMLKDYSEGTGSAAVEAEKSANNWE